MNRDDDPMKRPVDSIKKIKLKVCGMRHARNVRDIAAAGPDILGFIFYPPSPRYLPPGDAGEVTEAVPEGLEKAGVFVNSPPEEVERMGETLQLDYVQLHGKESPRMCKELKNGGLKVIKVFGMDENFDLKQLDDYKEAVDYFLFDTKSPQYGGTGKAFNWSVLDQYDGSVPFFLSGGIGPEHVDLLESLRDKNLYAVDVNSRFEISPGFKDREKVKIMVERLKILNVR